MRTKKTIWLIGFFTLAVNLVSVYFFLNRNKFGDYTLQPSYEELYSLAHNTPSEINTWKQAIDQYPSPELEKGKKLTMAAGISNKEPSFSKMIKIGAWLRQSFSKCTLGKPTEVFEKLSITEQYKSASNAESPVWCGTYGSHFFFFCSVNDITCRCIESSGGTDNHIINECFIPELGQWVFVDLLNNVLYCQDKVGKILNTVDLLYRNARKDTTAFTAFGKGDNNDSVIVSRNEYAKTWQNYLDSINVLRFYHTSDLARVYSFREKATRYVYPKVWYETFSLNRISNKGFYLRIFFFYSGIILAIIFILLYLKSK